MAEKKRSTFGVLIRFTIVVLIIVFFLQPKHKQREIIDFAIDLFSITDPGVRIELSENSNHYKIIKTYKSDVFKEGLILYKGDKDRFGLSHILARHTLDYFESYHKASTLFPSEVSARDIIKSLRYFVKHCVIVYGVNRRSEVYDTYLGYIKLDDGDLLRCILVVDRRKNSIVTFYPFGRTEEEVFYQPRYIYVEDYD